jgi:uncharacterized protein (DUF362 family)
MTNCGVCNRWSLAEQKEKPVDGINNMLPAIQPIQSYEDGDSIRQFVCQTIQQELQELDWDQIPVDQSRLVVIKPNWIQEGNEENPNDWEALITHPKVLIAVVEALSDEMKGCGSIAICDAPHGYADFKKVLDRGDFMQRLNSIREANPGINFEILDLRRTIMVLKQNVVIDRVQNVPDPRGYVRLDMGRNSLFFHHCGEGRYYGADYDRDEVNRHHHDETHEYLLAGTPIACDLFINLPKLKTHKKTGITCALKNLVGINGDKNWLPHHTEGPLDCGGDEFPEQNFANVVESMLKKVGHKLALQLPGFGALALRIGHKFGLTVLGDSSAVIRNGNWYGNNTCWRMVLDLNRALLFGISDGTWSKPLIPRNYLCIVDGIVGGEGNGPLSPAPVNSRVLFAGDNPAEVDAVACKLMGFDPLLIPLVREAFADHPMRLCEKSLAGVECLDLRVGSKIRLDEIAPAVPEGFRPHFGWRNLLAKAANGS